MMTAYYNSPAYLKLYEKTSHDAGIPALERLYDIAQGEGREAYITGLFIVNFYKGSKCLFNLQFLKELQPRTLMDCISVIHLEYNARQEIFDYLGIKVSDLEKLTYRILKKQASKPIPREIIIDGHSYIIDLTYKAGAKACIEKNSSNPHQAFSKKNLQWQFGYDNEFDGHYKAQGFYFEELN